MIGARLGDLNFGWRRRVPLVLQTEAAECGLACISMIAGYYGKTADLPSLRRSHSVSLKGVTFAHLMEIASSLGFTSRPVQLEMESLGHLALPCILHWNLQHFVVLTKVTHSGVEIHDPATGVRRVSLRELNESFTGVALELVPSAAFVPSSKGAGISIRSLLGEVRGLKRSLAHVLILALALEAFALVAPLHIQLVVDHAIVAADRELLVVLISGFALLLLCQVAISSFRAWTIMVISTNLNVQWAASVFAHLLRLPIEYFEKRHLGDVVSRFGSVAVIQRTITTGFIEAIVDGLLATTALAMLVIYSATLASISVVAVAIYGVGRLMLFAPLRNATSEQIVLAARQQSTFLESVRGVQSIKLFGREDDRLARYSNQLVDTSNREIRTQLLMIAFRSANALIFGLEGLLVVYVGAGLVLDSMLSVGMLFTYIAYRSTFSGRAAGLLDKLMDLKMLRLHTERLADIVLTPTETKSTVPAPVRLSDASLSIRDICYRYADTEPEILKKCTFDVSAGEVVAVIGASGSGKTTLLKIILGLLKPTSGDIVVGGVSFRAMDSYDYRKLFGSVMQEDQLFAGTMAENISFFDSSPDHAHLVECARTAFIHDDISRMPMGYATLVGDMGAALSGGQKQRLLLARALYRRPKYLLLDEATSHLDIVNESRVSEALRALSITRIVVAHRPETIATAQRVLLLTDGAIYKADDVRSGAVGPNRNGGAAA